MPCDRIITQSVDLSKCGDLALLATAAASIDMMGCTLNGRVITGNQRYVGMVADRLKQAYSKQVILKTARVQGWKVKDIGNNKLQVVKARY